MSVNVSKTTAYVALLNPQMSISKQTAYVVMLPDLAQHLDAIEFNGSGFLEFTSQPRVFPETISRFSVAFVGSGFLAITARRVPPFDCEQPAPHTWTRNTPVAGSWARRTPVPSAWACAGDEVPEANDVLVYVNGDGLVDVAGDSIKLIG